MFHYLVLFLHPDEYEVSPYSPFQYIYGAYTMNPDLQSVFKHYSIGDGYKSVLSGVDRIKLIQGILEAKLQDNGCGINLGELVNKGGGFTIHETLLSERLVYRPSSMIYYRLL
jgi:hypothetical protein